MRVVEQLIQHFWTRGALSRTEADYLVLHGFVRSHELQDYNLDNDNPVEPTPLYEPPEVREPAPPPPDIEDVLLGRRTGRKKQGGKKKPKPSGHNLAPLETRLHDHFKWRQGYPALMNLGSQIRPCSDWTDAATAVSEVTATDLEIHLVSVLSHRPQALGELWFSFSVEDLYT